jgi:choice-of-anchor A domain-containing protein
VNSSSVLNLGSNGAYSGSLVTGSQTGVVSTMSSVSSSLNALAANQTITGDLASDMTFTNTSTTGGTYVIDINGNVSLNSNTLNFVASNANDKFVVNVTGSLAAAQSFVQISGGITPDELIFNLTGPAGCSARVNKGTGTWSGTILAPACDIRVDNPHPFDGEAFGNTVTVDSAGTITGPGSVPEPSSILLFGSGLSAVSLRLRRRGNNLKKDQQEREYL